MKVSLKPPTIPGNEKSPFVLQLSTFIEQQASIIQAQAEEIQQLKDEIARLKNQPPRPKIKPSSLEKKTAGKKKRKGKKRPGSKKRKKTAQLQIHETVAVPLENIPQGAEFKGYKPFVVQAIARVVWGGKSDIFLLGGNAVFSSFITSLFGPALFDNPLAFRRAKSFIWAKLAIMTVFRYVPLDKFGTI